MPGRGTKPRAKSKAIRTKGKGHGVGFVASQPPPWRGGGASKPTMPKLRLFSPEQERANAATGAAIRGMMRNIGTAIDVATGRKKKKK